MTSHRQTPVSRKSSLPTGSRFAAPLPASHPSGCYASITPGWAASQIPDCRIRVLLCCELLIQVLVADFVGRPVAEA
jgi:hypothetical protein